MKRKIWTVEAGRGLCLDGVRVISLERYTAGGAILSPTEADALTHKLAALLNASTEPLAFETVPNLPNACPTCEGRQLVSAKDAKRLGLLNVNGRRAIRCPTCST